MALMPLAMLRSLALAQQANGGFNVPMVQRASQTPLEMENARRREAGLPELAPSVTAAPVEGQAPGRGPNTRRIAPAPYDPLASMAARPDGMRAAPYDPLASMAARPDGMRAAAPVAAPAPMPQPRPAGGGGGSYALPPSNAGLGKLKDILTAAAMGTIAAPPGAGMITSAASGFAGARQYKQDRADKEAAGARQAEQDALEAEYKRAQIANLQSQLTTRNLSDNRQDFEQYVADEKAAGREPLGWLDYRKTVGSGEAGQTERIAQALMAENPDLKFSEALRLAQKSPNDASDNLARERLAMGAAKEDPDWGVNDGKITDERILKKWRRYYGLEGPPAIKPKKKKKGGGGGGGKNKNGDTIPPAAIERLKENADDPKAITDFNFYWGPGAAERVLAQ